MASLNMDMSTTVYYHKKIFILINYAYMLTRIAGRELGAFLIGTSPYKGHLSMKNTSGRLNGHYSDITPL